MNGLFVLGEGGLQREGQSMPSEMRTLNIDVQRRKKERKGGREDKRPYYISNPLERRSWPRRILSGFGGGLKCLEGKCHLYGLGKEEDSTSASLKSK